MLTLRRRQLAAALAIAAIVPFLAGGASESQPASESSAPSQPTVEVVAKRVDEAFMACWKERGLRPAAPADAFTIARRLSLALQGTIPSLEEIRLLEQRPKGEQIDFWINHLLHDKRFHDYFAERLARAFVSSLQAEPFFVHHRIHFAHWLAEAVANDRPYDELVREMVAQEGLWTDQPAVNYITGNERDPSRLAARTARAFLGIRLDCAECHDHFFAEWKQADFEGLAAFFGKTQLGFFGIRDVGKESLVPIPMMMEKNKPVTPKAPFDPELLPKEGRDRERLARWITNSDNPYFAKAICNRVWALMLGRAIVEPVDDLQGKVNAPGVLDVLADDFKANGYRVHRLIRVIAATRSFQMESAGLDSSADRHAAMEANRAFAAFPTTRLRPEQVIGSILQSSSLQTANHQSHWIFRLARLISTNDFIRRYGDAEDDEMAERSGNIAQRLLLMNGKIVSDAAQTGPLTAAGRIAALAPTAESCVNIAYLVCLTRYPTAPEMEHFAKTIDKKRGNSRERAIEDMFWVLYNATEFSWNH